MTKEKKPYTTYTKDLKLEAIRLMETSDRPATEIAMELDFRSRFHTISRTPTYSISLPISPQHFTDTHRL